ncbi:MAG: NAD(P)-dependent oxidoreductase [Candidatus Sulfotelmatobacter sp.]
MTVLVTGASGLLGSRVVELLCASGLPRIRCFVRPSSDTSVLELLRHRYPQTAIEFAVGNLLCPGDAIRATRGVDAVYHLAAEMRGLPSSIFGNTVVGSRNLLDGIVQHAVSRVVLIGSIASYGVADLPPSVCVTEEIRLEARPEKRDAYCFAKVHQEILFQRYRQNHAFDLTILRSGVIYGEGGCLLPSRIGFFVGPLLFQVHGHNVLPLTYVENCASAVVLAAQAPTFPAGTYNVVDDDLPTSTEYLRHFRSQLNNLPSVRVPLLLAVYLAKGIQRYHSYSKAQIPLALTPYRVHSTWKGHTYSNAKLKAAGWRQAVPTREAISRTFTYARLRRELQTFERDFLH